MSEKVQSIIEVIKGLSLLEASELVKGWKKPSASVRLRPPLPLLQLPLPAAARQPLRLKRRPSSTSFSLRSAATRSASSRLFAKSPVWD